MESITLIAQRDDGLRATHALGTEQAVLVGTSSNCGLRLPGEGLSGCHCVISFEEGTLWVQDWASASGTFVNGEKTSAKVAVAAGDEIRIGRYRIEIDPSSAPSAPADPSAATRTAAVDIEPAEPEEDDAAPVGLSIDEEWDDDGAAPPEAPSRPLIGREFFEAESFEQETIALLRAEVEELQGTLAQRDAELAELAAAQPPGGPAAEPRDDDQADLLLVRLDELLDEAARGDERVAVLEDMLRTAEEANQAEQEERRQLESWVADIERRIRRRDEERDAEVDALGARLEEANEQRRFAERQLQQAASQGHAPKRYEETLERLQRENAALQEAVQAAQREQAALARQLEQAESREDDALREERAAVARERAMVSRLRSELSAKIAATEDMPQASQPDRELSGRIQTLREHLREIHQQEQAEQRESALTSRIARLWKRLDS